MPAGRLAGKNDGSIKSSNSSSLLAHSLVCVPSGCLHCTTASIFARMYVLPVEADQADLLFC